MSCPLTLENLLHCEAVVLGRQSNSLALLVLPALAIHSFAPPRTNGISTVQCLLPSRSSLCTPPKHTLRSALIDALLPAPAAAFCVALGLVRAVPGGCWRNNECASQLESPHRGVRGLEDAHMGAVAGSGAGGAAGVDRGGGGCIWTRRDCSGTRDAPRARGSGAGEHRRASRADKVGSQPGAAPSLAEGFHACTFLLASSTLCWG